VDGESSLVKIALPLEARFLDKFLVFRLAGNRRQLTGGVEGPDPLQIDVEETVGSGQQAGGFGRSVLAQHYDQRDGSHNQQNAQGDEEAAADAHRISGDSLAHPLLTLGEPANDSTRRGCSFRHRI
jgi:hypothetical protein